MTIEGIRLVRVDFDTLENELSAALVEKELGIFLDDSQRTAHYKANLFLRQNLPAETSYLGWDGEVYPKYRAHKFRATDVETDAFNRQEQRRQMAAKRAEEGVMGPEERTPTDE